MTNRIIHVTLKLGIFILELSLYALDISKPREESEIYYKLQDTVDKIPKDNKLI